ncbi:MAG: DUF222 domain-containing protein [Candidatus Nanopelagicales bacterium]
MSQPGFFELSRPALRRVQLRDELPGDHPPDLDRISALITALPDPGDLCAEEHAGSLAAAARIRTQIDAYLTALAGAADTAGSAQLLRSGTTGMMVATATTTDPATGSATVSRARALRGLPVVAAAYTTGRISTAHVGVICAAAGRIDGFTDLQQPVVEVAAGTEPGELRRILQLLADQCHPEALDRDHDTQVRKRSLALSPTPSGKWRLDGWLDAIAGQQLADALAAFTDPPAPGDPRTPTARRADALTDLVTAAMANTQPLGVSGLSILVDVEHLPDGHHAALDTGLPLGPASFDLYSCAAACSVIFGVRRNNTFLPLALGRAARRASRAQWAALIARDRGCIRCGRSPRYCHAHHIIHWKNGGLTDVTNMALLCSRCHHDLHHGNYTITIDEHGIPTITSTRAPPRRNR